MNMQHHKSTKKIEQIEKVAISPEKITQSIADVIDKFQVRSIFQETDLVKRCGFLVSTITTALIILPFIGVSSVLALIKSGLNKGEQCHKDAYYDVKNNPKINWRLLLFLIAKQFQSIVKQAVNENTDVFVQKRSARALIFDDSALEKTGKNIEEIGYIHDHVRDIHILGFKLLVCGFWDGVSFIPIDFSLHKETREGPLKKSEQRLIKKKAKILSIKEQVGKLEYNQKEKVILKNEADKVYKSTPNKTNCNKLRRLEKAVEGLYERIRKLKANLEQQNEQRQFIENEYHELKVNHRYCGLKSKDYKNQYKKQRDRKTAGYKRVKETSCNKIDTMIKMLKRAVSKGFVFDYVLTDTWFFSGKTLRAIVTLGENIKLVCMAKIGNAKYNILPTGKSLRPHEIINRYNRSRGKTNRKYKARYIPMQAEYQGIRVKIFLTRFGVHGNWRMLVTTELDISFDRIIEVYKIRWTIEVFFKECKQHLLLGKCQSLDFDAQIADTTLSLIRYILLSYYERIHYGTTIGGLFKQLSQSAIEENLLADINLYFVELLQIFANLVGVDFISFYEDLLRNNKAEKIIYRLGLNRLGDDYQDAA